MENIFDLNIFKEKFKKSRKSKNERLSTMVRLITEGKDLPIDITKDEYNYIITLKNISKKPATQKVDKPVEEKKIVKPIKKVNKFTKEENKKTDKITKEKNEMKTKEEQSTNKKESSK